MPRTARASQGGVCYHVLNRGNGRTRVFHDETDYRQFVELIGKTCERLPMRLLAYVLMPNHFHFVLWPRNVTKTKLASLLGRDWRVRVSFGGLLY